MNNNKDNERNWVDTLLLPQTDFPMRAGLPKTEPNILSKWNDEKLFHKVRKVSVGKEKFVLHDGPPYANGNLHIGHALNKILKDLVVRSQQMMNYDVCYVPGWDCHGLPIEWKVEERYREKNIDKDSIPINEFRDECREFADHWVNIQREEFKRLGIVGDWDNPYTTMKFTSESAIANELLKIAMNGALYQGSKPIMWSVVEKTALAEAEVEYHDYVSDAIWTKFKINCLLNSTIFTDEKKKDLAEASVVIWTTTPWTIPGNRAISYSSSIDYGLYVIEEAPEDNWAIKGEKLIIANKLSSDVMETARVTNFRKLYDISSDDLSNMICSHPLSKSNLGGYSFDIPLLNGDHVTDDTGTGFVHTAPGHGVDDFEIWMANKKLINDMNIDHTIPYTVSEDGVFTNDAPGFKGIFVIGKNGEKGNANKEVISKLIEAKSIIATQRFKHQYPHSWRSKKPVIFRNTPQWFISMQDSKKDGLRETALTAINDTEFYPKSGKNRLRAMIKNRPDWVLSRQRSWGVPISVFVNKKTSEYIPNHQFKNSQKLIDRIVTIFESEGANSWFEEGAKKRFLIDLVDDIDDWIKVDDILDVWFESGTTHAFVLEARPELSWPADLYLEGSDQHRGWFHSSLLESSITRGRAPYKAILTHGFTMDKNGKKMSKSMGNVISPQEIIERYGADILRLWVSSTDYADDQRIGDEILKSNVDSYRKIRNTLRWMLGVLFHCDQKHDLDYKNLPELEKYMLHKLAILQEQVTEAYKNYDFKKVASLLFHFSTQDLSAFYFDIRKDSLYCDPISSNTRKSSLAVIDEIFTRLTKLYAPILCFTMEEVWSSRYGNKKESIYLEIFNDIPNSWLNDKLDKKWDNIRKLRRVVTGALEIERREKRIGSSLEANPDIYITDDDIINSIKGIDLAEICITSNATLIYDIQPQTAFMIDDISGIGVVSKLAEGKKCARSWKIIPDIGLDEEFPDLSKRDAVAVREYMNLNRLK
jgi:isoleucyl-tRNA synthetase